MVLFALAMTSALAVGGIFVTRRLASSARLAERGDVLGAVTERVIVESIAAWDSTARVDQPIGSTVSISTAGAAGIRTEAWVTRTSSTIYWLVAQAVLDSRPPLRRRMAAIVLMAGSRATLAPERAWSELP
jgi:hypothetical protein